MSCKVSENRLLKTYGAVKSHDQTFTSDEMMVTIMTNVANNDKNYYKCYKPSWN